MIIVSTIQRSWPAHDLVVKVGSNEIDTTDPQRRALVERLFTPFIEARQFVIEPAPATPTAPTNGVA